MNEQERKAFEEANKVVHPVEDQWHYKILSKYGFVPREKTGVGFVRSYTYDHPKGHVIRCNTGASSDYWSQEGTNHYGYWSGLEPHIRTLTLD